MAPSDMMDGRIAAMKEALISNNMGNKVGRGSTHAGVGPGSVWSGVTAGTVCVVEGRWYGTGPVEKGAPCFPQW